MEKIKIALLDDESLIVNAIANLLSRNENIEIVSKDTNAETFLKNLKKDTSNRPDILLLDLNMAPINGIQVLENLAEEEIDIRVIVLSSLYNPSMYGYMIKFGISCFLPKYTEPEELFNAIESVYRTRFYYNSESQKIINEFNNIKGKNNPWSMISLTEREIEILKLICKEYSTKEIAERLFISTKTVEAHRSKLMEKIGCKNIVGMVTYAILNGIYVIDNQRVI